MKLININMFLIAAFGVLFTVSSSVATANGLFNTLTLATPLQFMIVYTAEKPHLAVAAYIGMYIGLLFAVRQKNSVQYSFFRGAAKYLLSFHRHEITAILLFVSGVLLYFIKLAF